MMTPEQFKELKYGDIVQNDASGTRYMVFTPAQDPDDVLVVLIKQESLVAMNPLEWTKVSLS